MRQFQQQQSAAASFQHDRRGAPGIDGCLFGQRPPALPITGSRSMCCGGVTADLAHHAASEQDAAGPYRQARGLQAFRGPGIAREA